jgi:hypothetical protein
VGEAFERLHRHEEVTPYRRNFRVGASQTPQRHALLVERGKRPAAAKTDRPISPFHRMDAVDHASGECDGLYMREFIGGVAPVERSEPAGNGTGENAKQN